MDQKTRSIDDEHCEKILAETTTRDTDGRFTVNIPLKHRTSLLGDSIGMADKRLNSLEQKFSSNINFKKHEYEELGHMTQLNKDIKEANY